ncbi:hypothetical protein [Rhizobium sp. BK251]|uniref:hypothetical protein n=1 Tax=Rhizobium sp. BK251 TaxID=2512125 RepID=UPI0010466991|nr:hypothetical protein [Rhizobium sp. BK251]TCL69783.1 hypothetical protein EV286_108359 [Rhizobium sp. BK251]
MQRKYVDMTMSEVLSDPLILSVARADGFTPNEFKGLLSAAANKLEQSRASRVEPAKRGLLAKMIAPENRICFQS